MIATLTNVGYLASAACVSLFFFGEIFLPTVGWFRAACSSWLTPVLGITSVLWVMNFLTPSRRR